MATALPSKLKKPSKAKKALSKIPKIPAAAVIGGTVLLTAFGVPPAVTQALGALAGLFN